MACMDCVRHCEINANNQILLRSISIEGLLVTHLVTQFQFPILNLTLKSIWLWSDLHPIVIGFKIADLVSVKTSGSAQNVRLILDT